MNYQRELLKGNTDSLLLYLLSCQPMYGYQIIKEAEKRSEGYFQFKEGTLYPAVHRLEKLGYIAGRWEKMPNGKERRYYTITDKGERDYFQRLEDWKNFVRAVNAVIQPSGG